MESFLKGAGEDEVIIPRHRSILFYLAVALALLVSLAVLAGAGYLIYRVAWGEKEPEEGAVEVEEKTMTYADDDLGYSLTYPEGWMLEQGYPTGEEKVSIALLLSSRKKLELRVYQLDPVVSIGGLEGIEEYFIEQARARMEALGAELPPGSAPGAAGPASGYAQTGPQDQAQPQPEDQQDGAGGGDAENPDGGDELEENGGGAFFHGTHVNGLPVFYTEFDANFMGEDTRFLLYYLVAGDYIFFFQGQAPAFEYQDVRPHFMAIARSLQWHDPGEDLPAEGGAGMSSGDRPRRVGPTNAGEWGGPAPGRGTG